MARTVTSSGKWPITSMAADALWPLNAEPDSARRSAVVMLAWKASPTLLGFIS
jgi:hypothetical protein